MNLYKVQDYNHAKFDRLSSLLLLLLLFLLLPHHLCRPQRHCSRATRPGILTSGHTHDSFCIVPPPQRSRRSDDRSLVGCHPTEILHCCRAI